MHNYRELKIWQRSINVTVDVYKVTSVFPVDERYGLTSQVRRAVVSVASNIAEGAGRNTNGEFIHFLGISIGSSFEVVTQLIIAKELQLVSEESIEPILRELDELQKMTYGFIETLKNSNR
ncbi:MAG: hypothetical protein RLZZ367_1947 [Bacteroidota bacterium]|jgi:four helix bundle protein